ncbi:MAG: 4Fe-4S dicluster domain-containing protein [Candidatus Sumerlaeia bacterium]|nr:4Fe-4S dicluster domain-containing protein [Candidatus Sumerlaeia bacterium]
MSPTYKLDRDKLTFAEEVSLLARNKMQECYNCGKCTAGCPVAYKMDPPIHLIMEMVQMGRREELLSSPSIWFCVSCETCSTRCPKEVYPSHVVDALRELALRENKVPDEAAHIIAFHRILLESIRKYGRLYEIGMVRDFKLQTLNLFEDINLGIKMFTKNKLRIFPHKIKDRKTIERIFKKYWRENESEKS